MGLFCAAGHPHLWTSAYYSHHLRVTNSNFCLLDSVRLFYCLGPLSLPPSPECASRSKIREHHKVHVVGFFSSSLRDHSFYNLYFPITTMTISYIYFVQFSYLFIAGNKNKVSVNNVNNNQFLLFHHCRKQEFLLKKKTGNNF